MKIYYFILLDHKDQEVVESKQRFGSSRHAAAAAKEQVDNIPPCADFRISYFYIDAKSVAKMLSGH